MIRNYNYPYSIVILLNNLEFFNPILEVKKMSKIVSINYRTIFKDEIILVSIYLCVFASLATVMLILLARFKQCYCIMGFDSPYYVYGAELVFYYGIKALIGRDKIIVLLLSYLILRVTNNPELTGVLLPLILGAVYSIVSFYVAFLTSEKNKFLATIVGLTTALTFHFIRISYDLYGQLLANSILLVILYTISLFLKKDLQEGKNFLNMIILLILLAATHFWTIALVIVFIVLILISLSLRDIIIHKKTTKHTKINLLFSFFIIAS